MEEPTAKRRRHATEMFATISNYEQSGQSRKEFCTHHQIKLATFAYWRTKYLRTLEDQPSRFVSLVPEHPTPGVELHYGEVKLNLGSNVSVDYVVRLVQKLAERC